MLSLRGVTSGYMSNQGFTYGTAQKLTANAFRRTGYTFTSWNTKADGSGTSYADQKSVNNLTTNGGTVELYAQWTVIDYTINYELNGGELPSGQSNPTTYNVETNTFTLINPTRKGYDFAGWTEGNGTTPQTDVTIEKGSTTGALTYKAQWTPIVYTITYHLDGGSVDPANPTSYTIETPPFTLTNPIKPGYIFTGWTGRELTEIAKTVVIEQGSTTDRTYTANYDFAQITEGALSYQCTSGTEAKVTVCNPSLTSVTIPATVSNNDGTYTVTAIDATAFSGCT